MGHYRGGENRCAGMCVIAALVLPGAVLAGDLEQQCRMLQVDALLSTAVFSCEKQIISVTPGGQLAGYTVTAVNARHIVLNADNGTTAIWHVVGPGLRPRIDYFHPASQVNAPATWTAATRDETEADIASDRIKP
jgi:hypothetical protein